MAAINSNRLFRQIKPMAVILIIIIVLFLILNIPIFTASSISADRCFENSVRLNPDKTVCILRYHYTTGAGWIIDKSSNSALNGKPAVIQNAFDPRLLRDNSDFKLDYTAEFVITANDVSNTSFDDENVFLIKPKSIVIISDTAQNMYQIKDLSVNGIFKSIIGVFNSRYQISF